MSNTLSRLFRAAYTTSAPLGGRTISAPRPVADMPSRVTATDFLQARAMINPAKGQSPTWQAVGKELRRSYVRDVLDHPLARGAHIAGRGNLVLLHVRHTGRHLTPQAQRSLVDTHKFVPVGSLVSLSDARGNRHTFTWALPRTPALAAMAASVPAAPLMPRPAPRGFVLGIGGLEGPAGLSAGLLGLPPARTYLGTYAS